MSDASLPRHGSDAAPAAQKAARPARRLSTVRTISALIMREMQTTYGRSPGGYIWAVLEPLGGIVLLSWILAMGFRIRTPPLGDNLPLFIATGLLMITLFQAISNRTASALMFSKPLLFYPGVRFTDALIARLLLTTLTQIMVFYLLFFGIFMWYQLPAIIDVSMIVSAFLLTVLLSFGIGVLNCFLFNLVPLWENVWAILMRPLFILSTIFFLFESIPVRFRDIAWYNPLVHVIGLMRKGFFPTYEATWISPLYVAIVGSVCLFFGLLFLNRFHRDFLNR